MKFNSIDFITDPEQILPKLFFPAFIIYICVMVFFFLVKYKLVAAIQNHNLESGIFFIALLLIFLCARMLYRPWITLLYQLFNRKPFLRVDYQYLWYGVGKNQVYITWNSIQEINLRVNVGKNTGWIPNAHRITYWIEIIIKKNTALDQKSAQRSWFLPRIKRSLYIEDISHTSIHTIHSTLWTILTKHRRRYHNLQIRSLKNLQ